MRNAVEKLGINPEMHRFFGIILALAPARVIEDRFKKRREDGGRTLSSIVFSSADSSVVVAAAATAKNNGARLFDDDSRLQTREQQRQFIHERQARDFQNGTQS